MLTVLLAVAMMACGGPRFLERARNESVDFSGRWLLAEKPDTRIAAWMKQLSVKQEKRWRRDARRADDGNDVFMEAPPTAEAAPGQFSNLQWIREQDRREVVETIEWLVPASELEIKHSSQLLEIRSNKAQGTRRYVANESSSLIQEIGTFTVRSGWVENSYVIRSMGSGETDLSQIETYSLRSGGQQLEKRVEADVPGLGKQLFTFLYNRQ
jgi:hypothetical protein